MNSDELLAIYDDENEFGKSNGYVLKTIEPGHIEYRMTITKEHVAFKSVSHGGAIAALMDSSLGVAALSQSVTEGLLVSTVEFKLNYIKPAHLGDKLIGIGKVAHNGKSLMISDAHIYIEGTDTLIAKGQGTFNKYPMHKKGLTDVYETK